MAALVAAGRRDRNPLRAQRPPGDVGAVYARMASGVLFAAEQTSGLRDALESRNIIGIAQGLLMNRYGLTRDQSFEVLRRRSQESQTKLRDLAAGVVEQ